MMFRQLPQEAAGSSVLSVKVNVLPASPPDPALRADIEKLENRRSGSEKDMLESEVLPIYLWGFLHVLRAM